MTIPSNTPPEEDRSRESAWAQPVDRLSVGDLLYQAINLNVEGRQVVGPLQGFGQLWQKTYRVRLSGTTVTPSEVIKTWKDSFPNFWPQGSHFYGPLTGIAPREVAVINISAPGGVSLSTGVMVLYSDDESFTFMNPEGHIFSGWITFSALEEGGCTVAQAQLLVRANDPLYEIAFRLGGSKAEDKFWFHTLESLAGHFGVQGQPQLASTCVDPRLQWSQVKNTWHNAAIRSAIYSAAAPLRWIRDVPFRS